MLQKHKGACAELMACAWLLQRGWEVFRNVSAHGFYDIIILHPKSLESHKVQVRTANTHVNKAGETRANANCSGSPGAKVLVVFQNGHCQWAAPNETFTISSALLDPLPGNTALNEF